MTILDVTGPFQCRTVVRGDSQQLRLSGMLEKPKAASLVPYLAEKEVATLFRCSTRQVRGWRAAGVLPGIQLPGRSGRPGDGTLVRYRQDDVQRFEARLRGERGGPR